MFAGSAKILPWVGLLLLYLYPGPAWGQDQEEDEEFLGDESVLEQEQEFPDLVRADETSGVMDEFALLEEEQMVDEVVSASKHRQSIFWSPSAITVYTRDDIRGSGATVITDFLRRVPGFDVYEIKPSWHAVGARGLTEFSSNLILVLVDGREDLVELVGVPIWVGLASDMEEIERIEVIRGPGSALYGANAFSAVVNIVTTRERPRDTSEVYMTAGEQGFYRMQATIRQYWEVGGGDLSLQASLGNQGKHSDNELTMRHWIYDRVHGVLRYRKDRDLDLSVHAGGVSGGGIIFTHIGDLEATPVDHYWVMGQANFGLGSETQLKIQAYYTHHWIDARARSSMRAYDIWIADFPLFAVALPTADAQLQLDLPLVDDLLLIAGANLRYSSLECDQYDPRFADDFRGAGFLHLQWIPWEKLQLTGGLRLDLSTETSPALSPRVVAVFRPWSNHAFRLGYGMAFRKPSLYESQVHGTVEDYNPATPEILDVLPVSMGNGDLINEKLHSFELGWRGWLLDERLQLSADLFFNIYRDTISFVVDVEERMGLPDLLNSKIRYENDPRTILAMGGEAEVKWQVGDSLSVWGNIGVRRVTHEDTGETLPSEPTLRANLGGDYRFSWGLNVNLAVHHVSSYAHPFTDPDAMFEERLPRTLGDNTLLLGRIGYRVAFGQDRSLELGLQIRTPLGNPFREYPGGRMTSRDLTDLVSDCGGEYLPRYVTGYLRGTL